MQRLIIYVILLFVSLPIMAQNPMPEQREDGAYLYTDEAPEFPGGQEALNTYIKDNLVYPKEAAEKKITGNILVNFVIGEDGTIQKVKVTRSVDPLLDNEAKRIVESMPKWKPGKTKGKNVPVAYTIPISFKLNQSKPEFTGIWQMFTVSEQADGKQILIMRPYLKIFEPDGSFKNIQLNAQGGISFITGQGTYKITSESTYTENIKSHIRASIVDEKNMELKYAFASYHVLISSYQMPGSPLPSQEMWMRVGLGKAEPIENNENGEKPQGLTEQKNPQP